MQDVIKLSKDKMEKSLSVLKEDLTTVRAGRANPGMLSKVTVDYYGAATPLKQIASISVPEPRTLQITPYDKSAASSIEKAIISANLGFNPTNDGSVIRISVPQLTEERRKELAKQVQKLGEDAKISVRNVRRETNDTLKKAEKDAEISEDDEKKFLDEVQKLTDEMSKKIDDMIKKKEDEIMEI